MISGIVSVWYSRQESVWVYPTGLINTILYTWLSIRYHLPGEGAVNCYYTLMSLYGWYEWSRRNEKKEIILKITYSSAAFWKTQLLFFAGCYTLLYFSLIYLKDNFFSGAIPWADALASAAAFTGMWLMTRKKVESWYWWMLTNATAIPLYYVKGLTLTSLYYVVLALLAVSGWKEWQKKASLQSND